MKHRMSAYVGTALAVAALAFASVIPAGATPGSRHLDVHHEIVATFTPAEGGSFAESLAMGSDGTLYASVTDFSAEGTSLGGRVWAIEPGGTPVALHSTTAPNDEPSLRAASSAASQRAAAAASGQKNGLLSISPSSNAARSIASPPISTR
jgi:glucose/arabinose dehydrogenase